MSTQTTAPETKRDAKDRPHSFSVAALRSALLAEVKPEDMAAIARSLIDLAKDGNVQAAKLVLAYTLGKPDASFAAAQTEAAAAPTVPLEEVLSSLLASAPLADVGRTTPPSPNGVLDNLHDLRIVSTLAPSGQKKASERR